MVKNHIKTIAAPKTWPIERKKNVFTVKPAPGQHSLKNGLSLNLILVDLLKIARIKKEVNYILHNKEVLVDGKRRKDRSFSVGLFDTLSIKETKKNYRVIIDTKGKLKVIEIDEKEAGLKPCKIIGKNLVKNKVQLNLFDGKNFLVDKGEYNVGDTVIVDLANGKLKDHLKLEKGNTIFLVGGKHMGGLGTVEDVIENKIIYKIKSKEVHETSKKYAFVIGKDKPAIKIPE